MTAVNTMFDDDLLARLDEYGRLMMPASFNAMTARGRSAVVRELVAAGLEAEAAKLRVARRRRILAVALVVRK